MPQKSYSQAVSRRNSKIQETPKEVTKPAQPARAAKEICAEAFVLVDSAGRKRARLATVNSINGTATVLALYNEQGQLRATLREDQQEAALSIHSEVDEETEEVISIGYKPVTEKTLQPGITMYGPTGHKRALLGVNSEGDGQLTLFGADDSQMSLGNDGLTVWDAERNIVAEVGTPIGETSQPATSPSKNANSQEERLEDWRAFCRIADAFATLDELSGYIPSSIYQLITEAESEYIGCSHYTENPQISRAVLPFIFAEAGNSAKYESDTGSDAINDSELERVRRALTQNKQ